MRLLALTMLMLVTIAPFAAGETAGLVAAGGSMGTDRGVAGAQWGPQSAVGVRYWFNGTEGDSVAIVLTTCYVAGSGVIDYCERHHVAA